MATNTTRDQSHTGRHAVKRSGACVLTASILIVAALFRAPARAEEPSAPRLLVAVLPIKLLDTSAEPTDQSAEHARRLAAMTEALARDLREARAYETLPISRETLLTECPGDRPECLLAAARQRGAGLVFIGVVHKSSTLIMQMWARLVDARTGKDVFSRDLNFRGDNDDAWKRAEAFLFGQITEAGPRR